MKTIHNSTLVALLLAMAVPTLASAQEPHVVHDRLRGEISIGTQAPTREALVQAIRSASPTALFTLLEYGERVECHECVPLLERKILESNDARVREISAWWLRRRPFAIGAVMARMRTILESDADPVRRARAAEAIGEFLDPTGLEVLTNATMGDADAGVRASAVKALGRLNHPGGNAVIAAALGDADVAVRRAAIGQVLLVNFFREHDALIARLDDADVQVRRRAALLTGELRLDAAVPALIAMLQGDTDRDVRQASAWALGRIGTTDARAALTAAATTESESLVRDAIQIALRMR